MNDIATGDLLLKKEKQSYVMTLIVVFVLIAALVFFYFFAFIPIDGESMENTIPNNRQCLVLRKCFSVERGDIVIVDVSTKDDKESHEIIKRVIAVAGDKLIFMRGENRNIIETYLCKSGSNRFIKLNEPYIKEDMLSSANNFYDIPILNYTPELTTYDLDTLDHQIYAKIDPYINYVPKNSIFFLGDNRNISRDSRYYGTRPLSKVKYKVLTVI